MRLHLPLPTLVVLLSLLGLPSIGPIAQERELVSMPAMMQEHLLRNMREHLEVISTILDLLSQRQFDQASEIAEKRLGMSSLGHHGAAHMAKLMPEPMQEIGSQMHRAASRFALAAEDASVTESAEDLLNLYQALSVITHNCNACHRAYRIR